MRALGVFMILAGSSGAAVDFGKDVQPILRSRCGACHSEQAKSSGFSVATSDSVRAGGKKHGRAVVGGQPEASPLIQMIQGQLTPRMPMGADLPPSEIATLEAWVRELPPETASAKSGWCGPMKSR